MEQREITRVFDIEVEADHAYFAAESNVLSHNCGSVAQPGEDLFVGTYNQSKRANVRSGLNPTHTPHHAVQNAVTAESFGRGITINIRKDLHEKTATMRSKRNLATHRAHLAADVRELRTILHGAGYDRVVVRRQLRELVAQNKRAYGKVFDK